MELIHPIKSNYNIFKFSKINMKLIIFIFFCNFINIKSIENFKALYLSGNYYYMITSEQITYYEYNNNGGIISLSVDLIGDQIIATTQESEMISLGKFRYETSTANLLIVKHYVYAILNSQFFCYAKLNEIVGFPSQVIAIKCQEGYCYYVVGIINSNKELKLFLYKNPSYNCEGSCAYTFTLNNIGSDNFSCELMKTNNNDDILVCFYQIIKSNYIIANRLNVMVGAECNINSFYTNPKILSNGIKIIKTSLSQDYKEAFVCYINIDNDCKCLTYNSYSDQWSNSTNYLSGCLAELSSLNIEYFDNKGEYILLCFQSLTRFNLKKLDSNYEIKEDEENGIYDLSSSLDGCNDYYISSLIHNQEKINMFVSCDKNIISRIATDYFILPTTIITTILTTFPITTIITTLPETTIMEIITTLPETTILTTLSETTILTTLPESTILTTLPETTILTILSTTILTTLPETTILSTLSETTILTTLPESTILITLPETTILTTLPESTILTTFPETKILTNLPETTTLTTLPKITILTTSPDTTILITLPVLESTLIIIHSTINIINVNNNENEIVILQEKTKKTKEEIVNKIDQIMKEHDIGTIYEIFGEDYTIKISPINARNHENISTYIEFYNCENILRERNHLNSSNILTVLQIEIENQNEQSLINDVEYAIYNENKEKLDLSVCEKELIEINYELKSSMINMSKIEYYSELGVDVFNLKDQFFNDICYSYSEGDSDLILDDRVSDIFQNFSICENNCNYNKINLTENLVSCKCSIKMSVKSEVHPPKLDKIIRDSFVDSNFGVMKCFNLVFSFKNKLNNIGFLIFTSLSLLHLPFFIHYFIYRTSAISSFIYGEMRKFNYFINRSNKKNPPKKNNINKKKKNTKFHSKLSKYKKDNRDSMIESNTLNKKVKEITTSRMKLYKNKTKKKNIKSKNSLNENVKLNKNKRKILKNKKLSPAVLINYTVLNKNYINSDTNKEINSTYNTPKLKNKKAIRGKTIKLSSKAYSLIQIDANNTSNKIPSSSDFLLDNYNYESAIIYDKRSFCRLFYICILAKENIINIIFFKTPLDLVSLRICLFIFSYSSDLAFNTIFYSNQNISDKYHYKGDNLILFTIVNNSLQTILSAIVGLILVNVFQHMIDARGSFEDIFRDEEKKMRLNKQYKVTKMKKIEIYEKIRKISFRWKCKIIFFIIFEFTIMLFYYYFVTAFCEVYKKTQISWIYDFFMGFIISFATEIVGALVISIIYILSIRYKLKFVYNIIIFLYNL